MNKSTLLGRSDSQNKIVYFLNRNRNIILEIISGLYIVLFLYTAINKTFNISDTVGVIKKTIISSDVIAQSIAWGVVGIEYVLSFLLFLPATRRSGIYASIGLMSIFTVYIIAMKLFAEKIPCSCGGVISKMSWTNHLMLNLIFIFLGLMFVWLIKQKPSELTNTESQPIIFT